jgi:predicted dehydrogenase
VDTPLRIAVVGVGHLGRHHARILSTLPSVALTHVVDIDESRARSIADQFGGRPLADVGELTDQIDAAVVAVPTEVHLDVALPLLARGVPVLVEKPMARSLDEADRLIGAARDAGVLLSVGHTERYNPAVALGLSLLTVPRFIEAHRLGTFPDRSLDIDVVFDLMIHDLDIISAALGCDVATIEAVGVPVLTDKIDIANVRLKFESGCIANLTASRIHRDRVRKIRFFQHDAYLSIDCSAQEVEGWRLVRQPGRPQIQGGKLDVTKAEPLERELADFTAAVRAGRPPIVTAEDGRRALALAEAIVRVMDKV